MESDKETKKESPKVSFTADFWWKVSLFFLRLRRNLSWEGKGFIRNKR